jgi:hypothetical protein
MNKNPLAIKMVAVFLVCFFMVAAVHEAVPGLCRVTVSPRDTDTCPFCKLIYTIAAIIALCLLVCIPPGRTLAEEGRARVDISGHIDSFRLRGPPIPKG